MYIICCFYCLFLEDFHNCPLHIIRCVYLGMCLIIQSNFRDCCNLLIFFGGGRGEVIK